MLLTCSHVLVKVRDLHRAVRDFRALGFTVDYAAPEATAQHAHIWFARGPIIEILVTPRNAGLYRWPISAAWGRGAGPRMVRWSRVGEGFCDVALATEAADLTGTVSRLRGAGVPVGRTVTWRRTRPDGERTRFQFAYPRADRLPFVVTRYDPPQHPTETHHPNGATAVSGVLVGVAPADRAGFDVLAGADPVLRAEPATVTGVRTIELTGLRTELDPARLHGAVLVPSPSRKSR